MLVALHAARSQKFVKHCLRATYFKAGNDMHDPYARHLSRLCIKASLRSANALTEKSSQILFRAAVALAWRSPSDSPASKSIASASALGSHLGTTIPVSPTIRAESPASVTTQGAPQAMASATEFGKPSLREEETAISNALHTLEMSVRGPAQIKR